MYTCMVVPILGNSALVHVKHQDKKKSARLLLTQWGYGHSHIIYIISAHIHSTVNTVIEFLLSHFRPPQDRGPTLPLLPANTHTELRAILCIHAQLNCSLHLALVLLATITFQVIITFQMSWSSPIQTELTSSVANVLTVINQYWNAKYQDIGKCQQSDGYHAVLDTWFGKGLG